MKFLITLFLGLFLLSGQSHASDCPELTGSFHCESSDPDDRDLIYIIEKEFMNGVEQYSIGNRIASGGWTFTSVYKANGLWHAGQGYSAECSSRHLVVQSYFSGIQLRRSLYWLDENANLKVDRFDLGWNQIEDWTCTRI